MSNLVQIKNPRTGLYVRINRKRAILLHKKSKGPFKGIPIIGKKIFNSRGV